MLVDFGNHTKTMTRAQVLEFYRTHVNKKEYPSYDTWLYDMKRCGLITE